MKLSIEKSYLVPETKSVIALRKATRILMP
jgi:hypothetical protein